MAGLHFLLPASDGSGVARISTMVSTSGRAGEATASSRCSRSDARTSSAPKTLPLWNVTPRRRLNVQVRASGVASQLSASSPTSDPSAATSVSVSKMAPCADAIMNRPACVRESQLSDAEAPDRPAVSFPPKRCALAGSPDAARTAAATPFCSRPRLLRRFMMKPFVSSASACPIHAPDPAGSTQPFLCDLIHRADQFGADPRFRQRVTRASYHDQPRSRPAP